MARGSTQPTSTMGKFPKPCLQCGKLTQGTSYCDIHWAEKQALREILRPPRPKGNRPHYQGDYWKRAKEVRENAAVCHICKDGPRYGDPWTADHLIAGDPNSPLAPAHRSCNSRRGNKPLS